MLFYQNKEEEIHYRTLKLLNYRSITVSDACQVLECSRSTIWRQRKKLAQYGRIRLKRGPKVYHQVWNRTNPEVENLVLKLRKDFNLGPDRLKPLLDEQGIILSRMTIYRILLRKKILPRPKTLRRSFLRYTLGYPGAEVQIDSTYIEEAKRPFWVFAAIDDHTRWGLADFTPRCTLKAAIKFLKLLVQKSPFPIQAVRTDRGKEFGPVFSKACRRLGMIHLRNRIKTPRHNGKVERFLRTIQEECLWRFWHWQNPYQNYEYQLNLFLSFYNYHRPHQGLGMAGRTPFQQLTKYINQNLTKSISIDVAETVILYKS